MSKWFFSKLAFVFLLVSLVFVPLTSLVAQAEVDLVKGTESLEVSESVFSPEYKQYLLDLEKGDTAKYGDVIPMPIKPQLPLQMARAYSLLSTKYDPRTTYMTSVKDQGSDGPCWAFASIGNVETLVSFTEGQKNSYSEEHMRYYISNQLADKSKGYINRDPDSGGNFILAASYLTNWVGPVASADAPYNPNPGGTWSPEKMSAPTRLNVTGTKAIASDVQSIKGAILSYGSVYAEMNVASATNYYNSSKYGFYRDRDEGVNHAILLCGWDDDFPIESFGTVKPTQKGAFLVKDSAGTNQRDKGYFWISYADKGLMSQGSNGFFAVTDYQQTDGKEILSYDLLPLANYLPVYAAANVYDLTSWYQDNASISDVMIYSGSVGSDFEIFIVPANSNGAPPAMNTLTTPVAKGKLTYEGYVTVTLPTPYTISSPGNYAIIVKQTDANGSNNPSPFRIEYKYDHDEAVINPGESWHYYGGIWNDNVNINEKCGNFCIRPILQPGTPVTSISLNKQTLSLAIGGQEKLTATALPANASNSKVIWSSSNPEIAMVDTTGKVTGVATGTATVTAKAGDRTVSANVEVLSGEHYGMIKEVFPDPMLASYIALQLNLSVDDLFTVEDARRITKVKLDTMYRGFDMVSLEGMEYLTNLEYFLIWEFAGVITEIDVSSFHKLEYLYICDPIKNIDLSNNPKLKELIIGSDHTLTSLDLSNNPELELLEVSYYKSKNIDLSNNLELRFLCLRESSLDEVLDLSKHIKLEQINIDSRISVILPDHLLDRP